MRHLANGGMALGYFWRYTTLSRCTRESCSPDGDEEILKSKHIVASLISFGTLVDLFLCAYTRLSLLSLHHIYTAYPFTARFVQA
jgi:hypothetical protein